MPEGTVVRSFKLKKYNARRRSQTIQLRAAPETRARLRDASSKLLMNQAEFFEWLMERYAKGLVIVLEEGAVIDTLSKQMVKAAEDRASEVAERRTLRVLYDRGFIDSPELK